MVDWGPNYAGRMVSSGSVLTADWREEWIGEWHLGLVDRFTVAMPMLRKLVIDPRLHATALKRGIRGLLDELVSGAMNVDRVSGVFSLGLRTGGHHRAMVRSVIGTRQWFGTFRHRRPLPRPHHYRLMSHYNHVATGDRERK